MGRGEGGGAGGSGGRQRTTAVVSNRNLSVTVRDGAVELMRSMLGRELTTQEIGDIIGAQDGSS